ncbi:hypothetical protein MPTK1_5g19210 [Marchantia polymorpha subsp. ruderalis]|uniref:Uncharacterized protein n=2 Tax=Marchantia polymorpha TaxID=3197 RepID=A0AAF6BJZ7_MARPO|nr:hypothetical protein MARPO_0073s0023 [Marchantia polymorpha]BBN12331.1 hypothetical protein Mp_5g19210 [Marchantia polymorpha subsp. ruderalis]|eukprot:PTQ35147.1 hypothetical protein MARPO_0073s0023 [Marchantia polymorpha]
MPRQYDLPLLIMCSSRRYLRDSHCPEGDHGDTSDCLATWTRRLNLPCSLSTLYSTLFLYILELEMMDSDDFSMLNMVKPRPRLS